MSEVTQTSPAGASNDDAEITLGVLNAVETNEQLTQRSVASELGIALGLANAYLKRCVKKGLIKVRQAPRRRYAYYLTPHGFAEKSRLTAEYLTSSLTFFRRARNQLADIFDNAARQNLKRIALVGAGDLAEIAVLSAREYGVELVAVVAPELNKSHMLGLPVVRRLEDAGAVDAVLIVDMRQAQAAFSAACDLLPRERVLAPSLLNVVRNRPAQAEAAQ